MGKPEITVDIPDHIWQVFNFLANPRTVDHLPREMYDPIVTIGRERLYAHSNSRIDSFCKLECGEGIYIGELVHIASFCHLGIGGGLLILESGSSCASGVKIITGSNQPGKGHGCSAIDPSAKIKRSFVHVRRNATLYTGVIVCPGVTIGEGSVVLPGAVVTKDVPDGETWGGVPAGRIKPKDPEICFFSQSLPPLDLRYAYRVTESEKITEARNNYLADLPRILDSRLQTVKCPACSSLCPVESKQCGYCGALLSGKTAEGSTTKCDPSCGCGVKQTHVPVKTPGMDSGEVADIDVSTFSEKKVIKVSPPPKDNRHLGESLDMWVAAEAEMYCWDDDSNKNIG